MAMHENVHLGNCNVRVVNSVAQAIVDRFCVRTNANGVPDEMITFVPPAATGGIPDGIIAMKPDAVNIVNGVAVTSYVVSDGCEATIELREACADGALLRCGGFGGEVAGAAYLADAAGDVQIGKALEAGAVGQIIRFIYKNYGVHA